MEGRYFSIVAEDNTGMFYWGAMGKELYMRLSQLKDKGIEVLEIFSCGSYPEAAVAADHYIKLRKKMVF